MAEGEAKQLLDLLMKIPSGQVSLAQALGLHPKILDKLTDKASGLVQHGKLDEAEKLLADLANVDNTSPVLPFLLGACRVKKQDLVGATTAYGEGLIRAERIGFTTMVPRVRICRAQAFLELGKLDEARADLAAVAAGTDAALAKEARAALERL